VTKFDRFENDFFFLSRNLGQNELLYDILLLLFMQGARKNSSYL